MLGICTLLSLLHNRYRLGQSRELRDCYYQQIRSVGLLLADTESELESPKQFAAVDNCFARSCGRSIRGRERRIRNGWLKFRFIVFCSFLCPIKRMIYSTVDGIEGIGRYVGR